MAFLLERSRPRLFPSACDLCRTITSSAPLLSGHNRWSKIRHDKAKNDRGKSKERQIIVKEISSATQILGPDTKFNPRLTLALSNAKRAEIPKAVIEAAIARGQGRSVTGASLEQVTIEAMLPHSVAAVIECQTDKKARVLQDVRYAINHNGGTVTPTTYLFEKKGRVVFGAREGLSADDYLDQAIEAGAMDIAADEAGRLVVFTEPAETKSVGESLAKTTGLALEELEIIWDPNRDTLVDVRDDEQVKDIEDLVAIIREDPSVRDIYLNCARRL